jgi:CRP-like cAMP-binding protein
MPIFEHLRPPVLESLARGLEPHHAAPGAVIIRQGDHGDAYYVIADGEVEVDVDGTPVARYGRAAGFGEIALLRDTPRTATVTAVTRCRLYRIEGDAFVTAVTRHAPAAGAADAITRERGGERTAA